MRLERRLDAPRDAVYRALIDPVAVRQWQVPEGMTSEVHAFDAVQGGAFRVSLTYDAPTGAGKSSAQTDTYHGNFVELVPGERVVQEMEFETDDPAMRGRMRTTYELSDAAGGGTLLVASHENVPRGVSAEDNETGWKMALDKLARLVG